MSTVSKAEKEKQKLIQDKCQSILNDLLKDEDNKYCEDCDAKGPRWASWNLGIFLCIRCAGIHRNLGVHISKVKSVNLDTWTPEQVVSLQQMGNSRARAVYEANLPDNFRRPQHDSSLESFIRAKYEQKKYIAKEWVPPPLQKVNWDKEIEESRKKKEKKSSSSATKVAALPTPDVSKSPKPIRAPEQKKSEPVAPILVSNTTSTTSASEDLLGLDAPSSEGNDIFSSFLSGPPLASVAEAPKDVGKRSEEEDSFFNQPTVDKKPLTKDSIMALYAQNAPAQQPQFPGMMPGFQPPQQPQQFAPMMNQMNPRFGNNPFFNPALAPGGFQQQPQQSNQQDLLFDFSSQQPSLPQQMGQLNLGNAQQPQQGINMGPFGSAGGATLSTNLWQ
ncbi:stromal membrane-associated protein 1 [Neocloeon triangulifer]|uniref:stromal membrane-associated protein 1 n=1 Tax=Neocloeon triangulifer TaxID=2078957 RepID=UPI00286F4985|nr:stromal membrane-associated protein 1 [Neocloeon triangulifer]